MIGIPDCPRDNCPACLDGPVLPHTSRLDGRGGIVGAYRCPECGETWTCSWQIAALEQPKANGDAA